MIGSSSNRCLATLPRKSLTRLATLGILPIRNLVAISHAEATLMNVSLDGSAIARWAIDVSRWFPEKDHTIAGVSRSSRLD